MSGGIHAGGLVHLHLPDGTEVGQDDHRLGVISAWLRTNAHLFTFKRILDLGSNCGHFPFVFRAIGAEVVAVEPNGENIAMFRRIHEVFADDRITIIQDDLRRVNFDALGRFDVLSTIGLVYHLNRPWEAMAAILQATGARLWLVESCLWPKTHETIEAGRAPDQSFQEETVLHPDTEEIERGIRECGFVPTRVDLGPTFRSDDKTPRGFWLARKA